MNVNRTPLAMPHLDQAARYMNLAWFVYGCFEREHRLTMNALGFHWARPSDMAKATAAARSSPSAELRQRG
jgi:hypothetical protein